MTRIKLNKNEAIVFMGSMNSMPMMYAFELKKMGYEVIYFVDAPRKNLLARPENHFPEISYPYPSWIVEVVLPSQFLLSLFPSFFAKLYQRVLRRKLKINIGCFVLNGFFSSLSPYLTPSARMIALSHGSDLDVWANAEGVKKLTKTFQNRSIFKYLPNIIVGYIIKLITQRQYLGYQQSNVVIYFPVGFNVAGDKVIGKLVSAGVRYIPRFDISFEPLCGQSREVKRSSGKIFIFSGVRFLFKTFPEGNDEYNKGNDIIIEGIAKYFLMNENIEVHFVEKGEDVQYAKELCETLGLERVVVWHKEMSFRKLLDLYRKSDICFDQIGSHWIGAIGAYALWLGKPLIANALPPVISGVWPIDNPVCNATSSDEVCEWLEKLENETFRMGLATRSKEFVQQYMSPDIVLNSLFDFNGIKDV